MGFASLQHMRNRRSLVRTACQPIAGTSAGFGYPLDALLPSTPCRFCFTPTALMGFTLRSVLLAKGIGRFPAGRTHIPFPSQPKSARRHSGQAGDPRFLGRAPFESPWRSSPCLAGQSLDAPLGFALPGSADRSLAGISPELLSRAWRTRTAPATPTPQSIDQLLLGLAEPPRRTGTNSQTTLVEFPRL
jgi:hypothetical protein